MKPWIGLLWAASLAPLYATPDLSRGISAFERRQWSESLAEFIAVLGDDPQNAEARAYVNLIARQMDNDRKMLQREKRRAMMEDAAVRLESNRQDPSPLQQAILNNTQSEQRAADERWRLLCEEARMNRENGQLLQANDIVLRVLTENPSYSEGQRELSLLQSALRQTIDGGKVLSIPERFVYQGFYAYGQADFENAVVAWQKARAILTPMVSAKEAADRLASYRFLTYEKIAQTHIDEEKQLAQTRRLFDQGLELYRNSHFTEALDVFRQVAIRDPDFPLLGHHLVKTEAAAEQDRARRLGEQKRKELDLAYQRGTTSFVAEKYQEAVTAFERVLSLDASHAQARSYLTLAKNELQKRHDPKAAQARYEAGLVAYASGKLDEASREWRMTLRLDASHEKARIALNKVQKELAMSQQVIP